MARLDRPSPERQKRVDERLGGVGRSDPAGDAIPRRGAGAGPAPLSPAQRRLWFLEMLDPGTAVHAFPIAFRLLGRLDVSSLERSLGELVRRHDALRTAFAERDGEPVQIVRDSAEFRLPIDGLKPQLRATFADHLDEYVRLRVLEEVRRPFDLANGPPFRARLLRLSRDDHVLILIAHHLVFDGWSAGILYRELGALYAAFAAGESADLAEPPIQYADYAAWQADRLRRGALDDQIAYWTRRLAGLDPLPILAHPSGAAGDQGARQAVALPRPLTDGLKALARSEGATLYMALLAAFQALLARYDDRDDVPVGSPIAGRTRPETEPVIGFFVNTLVLRGDLSDDPSARTLLRWTRAAALAAYDHQEAPFDRVVAALRPERGRSGTPLVSATFALHNAPRPPIQLPGLTVSRLEVETGAAPFDLSLALRETDEGLRGWLDYRTDRFDAAAMSRTAGHLHTLIEGAVADPDRPLSALPILSAPERHQLLVEWNAPAGEPVAATVHAAFEDQAARSPAAVAVVGEDETLTYGELNRRANRLAHRLRRLGAGPDVVVGLWGERSPSLVVAMLGILKAGGAYLPLDPADPPARRAAMLDAAGVTVVVTPGGDVPSAVAAGQTVVSVDAAALAAEPDANPDNRTTPEHLAYVVFTSGSTGGPKGAMVPHRAVARLVVGADYVCLRPDDVVAQAANPAFDATTFEVWGALLTGARLVVLPREATLSPRELAAAIDRHGITTLFLTTALLHLIAAEHPAALRGARQVLFGGEVADPRAVATVLEHGPPERLLHVYGPTETTTFATWHLVERVEAGAATIPIGRPIAGTTVAVLDRHGGLAPVGVAGELVVGGPGVARGYLGRPDLTDERFVPDPDAGVPAARRYRTGDRVRWRADGTLEFLGRFDDQVKVRGHRIEPAEVEAALRRHPRLRDAAVVARGGGPGGTRLLAYVVPAAEPAPAADELRAFLKASLPEFMLPAAIVALEALPLTANGKVDRAALPDPAPAPAAGHGAPPRTATETALARIWAELIGVARIGVDDDFFDLGGHSLLVARAIARIRDDLGKDLPIRALFEAPTVARLAERVDAAPPLDPTGGRAAPAAPTVLIPLQERSGRPPLFLVPGGLGGGRALFRLAMLARRLGPDQPVYGFLEQDGLDDEAGTPQAVIEATAAAYLEEVRQRRPEGPLFLGGTCIGGIVAFEMARQARERGEEVAGLFLLDTRFPGRDADGIEWMRRRFAAQATARARRDRRRQRGVGLERGGPPPGEDTVANRRALHAYGYHPRPYAGRVTLFETEARRRELPASGWDAVAGGLALEVIPGDHLTYLVDHLDVVAARLRSHLEAAWPASGRAGDGG